MLSTDKMQGKALRYLQKKSSYEIHYKNKSLFIEHSFVNYFVTVIDQIAVNANN